MNFKKTALKVSFISLLTLLVSENAYASRSSVSIMTPRNTVNISKDYTYGYSYLPGNALDVYETPNRKIGWIINYDLLDKNLLRPVSVAYVTYIPQGVRDCIYNFNQNLREVNNTVNNILVARPVDSSISVGRFLINSTIGIAGCFDVATHMGLERKRMSFDTVLGKWGVDQGAYLNIPFYGVSTYREMIGNTVDVLYFPYSTFQTWAKAILWVTSGVDERSRLLDHDDQVTNSLDPYIMTRDFYLMYAESLVNEKIKDGATNQENTEDLDSYMNEIDE